MEVILRIAAFLLKYIGFLLTPFFYLFNPYKKLNIPPNKNELLLIPVVDLAQKIRKREVHTFQSLYALFCKKKKLSMSNKMICYVFC